MRHQHLLGLFGLLIPYAPLAVSSSRLVNRAAVVVESPATGDTIVSDTDSSFNILWKNSTSNNVTISLRQGTPENMTLVHIISPSTFNNGTYAWRADDDRYLSGLYSSDRASSNCNYAMEFRTAGEIINSDFFTIISKEDGGISSNMSCPGGKISGYGSANDTSSSSGGSQVSTAALGGAVGGTAAGMLLILGLLFFLAKKKGWIMSKGDCEKLVAERLQSEESKRFLSQPMDKELAQADGGQIYQMP